MLTRRSHVGEHVTKYETATDVCTAKRMQVLTYSVAGERGTRGGALSTAETKRRKPGDAEDGIGGGRQIRRDLQRRRSEGWERRKEEAQVDGLGVSKSNTCSGECRGSSSGSRSNTLARVRNELSSTRWEGSSFEDAGTASMTGMAIGLVLSWIPGYGLGWIRWVADVQHECAKGPEEINPRRILVACPA